ncbi:hypothetical protein K501DRAFT_332114 [Backusella circina FSU 941]|nr:hypothetical protein K501DRAFT_332114 [Backusella circina FSU 941]
MTSTKPSSSTFVHKLYKYGFHKINKSPRGQRTTAENQIWEFSHPKFLKDRPDLLEGIRRKSVEAEAKKESKNRFGSGAHDHIQSNMAVMQITFSEMVKQLACLQDKFSMILRDLEETKDVQHEQEQTLAKMANFLQQNDEYYDPSLNESPPPIFITTHDGSTKHPQQQQSTAFMVQTYHLQTNTLKLSPDSALNTPVSPCPSTFTLVDHPPQEFSLPNSFQNPFYS